MANAIQSDVLGKFVWYDQMSNDLPGSEKFYSKVVGWDLAPNTMNAQKYTLLKVGEAMVGGLMPIPEDAAKMGVRPAWMGYIAVDDVKKYADKVKAAGGVIHRPPTEIPNIGTFAVAGDPSGAGFLLFKGDGDEAPMQDADEARPYRLARAARRRSREVLRLLLGPVRLDQGRGVEYGRHGDLPDLQHQRSAVRRHDEEDGPGEPASQWLYYISVDAIDAAQERVKSAGGQVIHGPMEVPGGAWIINGLDPQGAMFALVAPKR